MVELSYDHEFRRFMLTDDDGIMHTINLYHRGVLLTKNKLHPYNKDAFKLLKLDHRRAIHAKIDELREEEAKQKCCKEVTDCAMEIVELPKTGDGYGVGDGDGDIASRGWWSGAGAGVGGEAGGESCIWDILAFTSLIGATLKSWP
jgi:hypothetical protein